MFEFYLNDQLIEDPKGWDEFKERIAYDKDLHLLYTQYPASLTFIGSGYAAIKEAFDEDGYCQELPIKLYQKETASDQFDLIFEGVVIVADVKFNHYRKTAECPIQDSSISSKIINNKNIKAVVNAGISKNGESITAVSITQKNMFNTTTGGYPYPGCKGYDAYSVLNYLAQFMTDGAISLYSDWYTNLPTTERYIVITGREIRTQDGTIVPEVSFLQVFSELRKKYNLKLVYEPTNERLRMEESDYFKNQTTSAIGDIKDVIDIEQSVSYNELYSNIKLGSNTFIKELDSVYALPFIPFLSHADEEYFIQGKCNTDASLDVQSQFIIDSNVIEHISQIDTADDQYDNDIFLVQYNTASGATPTQLLGGVGKYQFNAALLNSEVAKRWNVQGDLAKFFSATDNTFSAERNTVTSHPINTATTTINPAPFQTEISDAAGNYNNSTHRFTAPQTGLYSFKTNINWSIIPGGTASNIELRIYGKRYSSASVLLSTTTGKTDRQSYSTLYSTNYDFTVYMAATNYLVIEIQLQAVLFGGTATVELLRGSTFECAGATVSGGVFKPNNPGDYFVSKLEFANHLGAADWKAIKENMIYPIYVVDSANENKKHTAYIESVTRTLNTGEIDWELVTRKNNL